MRERLLDAGWRIVRDRGLTAATTRNIAQEAGVAEGSIYKHFGDKTDLVLALVLERAGDVKGTFARLHKAAGSNTLSENLAAALADLIGFYENVQIVVGGSLSDPEMMKRMRQVFREEDKGPQRAHVAMVAYLEAERGKGRMAGQNAASQTLASLMLGAAYERAFLNLFNGERMSVAERRAFAQEIVGALFGKG